MSLDNPVDSDELAYWNKNVRPYYTEGAARIWSRNAVVSHILQRSDSTRPQKSYIL